MSKFELVSDFKPTGDQPEAIDKLVDGLNKKLKHQVLLGVTGSGKTYTIANVIAKVQRPALVMAHNKTLAAQLYREFSDFFPNSAVKYFVSYYDYYRPEAYIPRSDTYIEKETKINEEIERMRLGTTEALSTRHDVIIVASVSAIYGLGDPSAYGKAHIALVKGTTRHRDKVLRQLVDIHYERNDYDLKVGSFRVRGDTLEICPAYNELVYRVEFFGDEIDRITQVHRITGEIEEKLNEITIYPAKHFITTKEKMNQALIDIEAELEERLKYLRDKELLLEAQRLEQRTNHDLEMLREISTCAGVENYSRLLMQRPEGSPPWTLIDYFPDDFLMIVDESHMTLPQIRGMYKSDRSRKMTLVDYGFRLPSALDNRPLTFSEWESRVHQIIYTTATPGPYEKEHTEQTIEQVIRPTGLVDPKIHVRSTEGQIDDLLHEINQRVEKGQRTLITTLTKRMAEDLADYIGEIGISVHYLHSDIKTLERVDILHDLRLGIYDVIVGINLLREGLDLPEVSLVAILDADKEGFLRSESALIQTMGRAARHIDGTVIMYADKLTPSMTRAIHETNRRRKKQIAYNKKHGISPKSISKEIRPLTYDAIEEDSKLQLVTETQESYQPTTPDEINNRIDELEIEMRDAATKLEFERAAAIRDEIAILHQQITN